MYQTLDVRNKQKKAPSKSMKGPRFNLEHKAHESTYHNRNSNCFFIDSIGIG